MSSTISKVCDDIEDRIKLNRDPEALLRQCAKERLVTVYNQENTEFDNLLKRLDRSIDYSAYSDVKKCVTRLLRLMQSNRKTLVKTLRKVL